MMYFVVTGQEID